MRNSRSTFPVISIRADVTVLLAELICGLASVFIGWNGFFFVDFCFGAIMAIPLAVVLGLIVSLLYDGYRHDVVVRAVVVLVLSVIFNIAFVIIVVRPIVVGAATTERIKNLQPGDVTRITVREQYGGDILAVIEDDDALGKFVERSKDIRGKRIMNWNKSRVNRWQLKVEFREGPPIKMTWEHREDRPHTVYGHYMDGTSDSRRLLGSYYSKGLRTWFTECVQPRLAIH
jgi:hypothetical protein